MEEEVGDYQCGFRTNRSTIKQIFVFKLPKNPMNGTTSLHHLFVDSNRHMTVIRNKMYKGLQIFGIPAKLINLIRTCLITLFNMVLEVVMENVPIHPRESIFDRAKCWLLQMMLT